MPGRTTSIARALVAGTFPILLLAAVTCAWVPQGTGPSHHPDGSNATYHLGFAAPFSAPSMRPASPALDLRSLRTFDGFSLSGARGVSTRPIGRFLEAIRPLPWAG